MKTKNNNSIDNKVVMAETNNRMNGVTIALKKLGGFDKVNKLIMSDYSLKLIIVSDGSFKFVSESEVFPLATVELSAFQQYKSLRDIRAKVQYGVECELNYAHWMEVRNSMNEIFA